jgi:hypothetical protein
MKSSKKNKGFSIEEAKQFLLWHGEKVVVGIIAVVAVWLALSGMGKLGLRPFAWRPSDLTSQASSIRGDIESSQYVVPEEKMKIIDYAILADQIKKPINELPYRNVSHWEPPYGAAPRIPPPGQ